ncbi:MAG: RNA polymerase sigma factor [Oscillospiraceae bacterium]|nr:RNA polymerase sigma factor [Oscillospiraceae bacterium]
MFDMTFATIENDEQRNELSALYAKYKNRLFAIAQSNLHNEIDAEDAVQEVFSEIADKPEIFFSVQPEKRAAYLSSMVKKLSANMFNDINEIPKVSIDELNEDIEDSSVTLENALFDKINHDEVMVVVNKLPTMQRSVLILHCLYDLSIDETAQKLNISLYTVNKHLTLARKAIREFIEERRNHQ